MDNCRVLRVDMSREKVINEALPEKYQYQGGRSLTAAIMLDEVPPACHPLGPRNKCIMATGLFAGTPFPCSGRLSIGAKSPLTGGIKESNVGGTAAWKMARLGIRAIVIEKARPENTYVLKIDRSDAVLISCPEYKEMKTYQLCEHLANQFGKSACVMAIGPAGELKLNGAGIAVTDLGGMPCDYAGRGGLGAVWGAKGLKAIVLDDKDAERVIRYKDRHKFVEISRNFSSKLRATKKVLKDFGTAIEVKMSNELGYLPTRNYSSGQFEGVSRISGEEMQKIIRRRGGKTSKACMPGCPIHCSNLYVDSAGHPMTGSLEYETIVMLGSNCGIDDLDVIARMDRFCDDCGLDTIEMGAAIGVAMEAKILAFGDAKGAMELLEEIPKNTALGRIIGNGAAITGRIYGITRVPTVKGQSMAAYDPRSNKGIGVTYMSSAMGADHTAGCVMPGRKGFDGSKDYDLLQSIDQEKLSLDLQIMVAIYDAMGLCFFIGLGSNELRSIANLHNAKYGSKVTFDTLVDMGKAILKNEHEFNLAAGVLPVSSLPEFFELEKLPPHQTSFDVDLNVVASHFRKELSITAKN